MKYAKCLVLMCVVQAICVCRYMLLNDMAILGRVIQDKATYKQPHQQNHTSTRRRISPAKYLTLKRSSFEITTDAWTPFVDNSIYTYSAYLSCSRSDVVTVKILGVSLAPARLTSSLCALCCQLRSRSGKGFTAGLDISDTVPASVNIGTSPTKYRLAEYSCTFSAEHMHTGSVVALVHSQCTAPPKYGLEIHNLPNVTEFPLNLPELDGTEPARSAGCRSETARDNFTVCLWSPLYNYSEPARLVEWVEINRIFGAQKFIIHSESVAHDVDMYLRYYQKLGIMDVLPWKIPVEFGENSDTDVLYHLQNVLIRDCHLRSLQSTKYLVGVDIDEVIVPRSPKTPDWQAMLDTSGCPHDTTAYAAEHLYFGPNWRADPALKNNASIDVGLELVTLLRTRHSTRYYQYPERSKLIFMPDKVRHVAVHKVTDVDEQTCVLSKDIGALHHYRASPIRKFREEKGTKHDHAMHRYSEILVSRVKTVYGCARAENGCGT